MYVQLKKTHSVDGRWGNQCSAIGKRHQIDFLIVRCELLKEEVFDQNNDEMDLPSTKYKRKIASNGATAM